MGALATPLVFWLLIGGGIGTSFQPAAIEGEAINFLEYFYPGIIALILLFTAIFSTISVIEDRREGFLQGVMVAPVPRFSIALGKLMGGATLALIQGGIFLLLLPLTGLSPSIPAILLAIAVMVILAFALTGLGFLIAWRMDSTQGFHAIMTMFLIPMWMLSGAFFPPSGAHPVIQFAMMINPMSYGVDLLRAAFYSQSESINLTVYPVWASLLALISFAAIMLLAASKSVNRAWVPGGKTKKKHHH
jgi:ABC-2 type transport system permease protein